MSCSSLSRGKWLAIAAMLLSLASARPALAVIAYQIPAPVAGNQAFGGSLGLDFNVNTPITIDQLGVFDDGGNGLNSTITAHIYNRATSFTDSPVATVVFTNASPGALVGSSRFKNLSAPFTLPAGFQGTVVAEGYSATEMNGNSGGGQFDGTILNTGGGAITFTGSGRNGTAGSYPGTLDGGGTARYGAGTFNFAAGTLAPVALNGATSAATFSQAAGGPFLVSSMFDGNASASVGGQGWANAGNPAGANTAVVETTANITSPLGSKLQFTLNNGGFGNHTLGRFRISATGDDRSTFADGLANGGDVTATWTPVNVNSIFSGNTADTFTVLADGSILVGGASTDVETYTLTADSLLKTITGFRIEMLQDGSLPLFANGQGGPGRAGNGNYVLTEFSVLARNLTASELPEPASLISGGLVLLAGAAGTVLLRKGKRRKQS